MTRFNPESPPLRKTTVIIRDEEHEIIEKPAEVFEEALDRLTNLMKEVIDLILYLTNVKMSDAMTDEEKEAAYKNLEEFALQRIPEVVKKSPREVISILAVLTGYPEEVIGKWPSDLIIERLVHEIVSEYHWIADDIKKKTAPLLELLGIKEAKEETKEAEVISPTSSDSP